MRFTRSIPAIAPLEFGRRRRPDRIGADPSRSDDLRLFATTFAGGFLFVSLLIA